jgi:DNA (cytosine-5)-methyltransferase 1
VGVIRFGSICSGIEAASQAWLPLGWHCSFMSEIEAFPRAVLQHHYPETALHGDFTTIRAGQYEPIDVLVGGTPCQSFSVAGLRGGLGDERGNLALEFLRLAGRLQPRWIVWENVPGVFSSVTHNAPDPRHPPDDMAEGSEWVGEDEYDSDESHAFSCFLAGLSELGYGFAYRVLDAQYFGLAQRRKRVFVVGYFGDWRRAAAVLFEPASLRWHPPPSREAGQRIAAGLTRGADSGERGGYAGRRREDDENLVANPLGCHPECGWRGDLDNDTFAVIPLLEIGKGSSSRGEGPNGSGFGVMDDPMFTLQAGAQHGIAMSLNAKGGSGRMDGESETFVSVIAPALSKSNPYGDHESREGLLVATHELAYALKKRDGSSGGAQRDGMDNIVAHSLRAEGFDASEDGTGRGVPITLAIRGRGDNHELEWRDDGTANAILTPNGGRAGIGVGAVAFNHKASAHQSMNPGPLSPSLEVGKSDGVCVYDDPRRFDADGIHGGMEHGDLHPPLNTVNCQHIMRQQMAVRRLTPIECERLQGFPDRYTWIPTKAAKKLEDDDFAYIRHHHPEISEDDARRLAADGPRYQALGNSMAVPVMAWIGRRIAREDGRAILDPP